MAENGDNTETSTATDTDIFKQQSKTIELLYDVLQRQTGTSSVQQPTYVRAPQQTKPAPNYLLYIALAVGGYFLLKGLT